MKNSQTGSWQERTARPNNVQNLAERAPGRQAQPPMQNYAYQMPYLRNQANLGIPAPRPNNVPPLRMVPINNDARPGPSRQPPQAQPQNMNNAQSLSAFEIKRRKPKKPRKPKTTNKAILSEPPPPGFLTVSATVASKRANGCVPSLFEKNLQINKDLIITIRIYKKIMLSENSKPDAILQALCYSEYEFSGRNYVSDILENFDCEMEPKDQKGVLPGFFFIKNIFYVDKNQRATVQVDNIRNHIEARDLGTFSKKDMRTTALMDLEFKLGQNDLFIHGTSCEHIIVFSQMRLLQPSDLVQKSDYPRKTLEVKLTTENAVCFFCRDAKPNWVVSACARIQYHIALYCDTCYKTNLFDMDDEPNCQFNTLPYTETEPMVID